MEGLELICFEIISYSGGARSCFIEAMVAAKKSDFEAARKLISEGEEACSQAHKVHSSLIQEEAAGICKEISLMLIHAEDQLMSAEVIRIMAEEIINLHTKLQNL